MTFPDNFAADACFSHPKLAAIYDLTDGQRNDLVLYLNLAEEFSAKKILDLGCGTGSLAVLFAKSGKRVTAVDPAEASLHVARRKPHAGTVQWIHGTSDRIPDANFDLAVMTANVAQVFLTDEDWLKTLTNIKNSLNPNGVLAFETRNPAKQAWLNWTKDKTFQKQTHSKFGTYQTWCEVTNVNGELVSFTHRYLFNDDNTELKSESTLRFRTQAAIVDSLKQTGFNIKDIRDAPDRPGKEWIFIAATA